MSLYLLFLLFSHILAFEIDLLPQKSHPDGPFKPSIFSKLANGTTDTEIELKNY